MTEQGQPFEPSALGGNLAQTAGNPEHTLVTLSTKQRHDVALRMDPVNNPVAPNESNPLRLESGVSLEAQCNANYSYLNTQGIGMSQYVGALRDLRTAAIAAEETGQTAELGYSGTISGYTINPLTGATERGQDVSLNTEREEDLLFMIGETEIAVAEAGIFAAPSEYTFPEGGSRAEQIISAMRATEAGRTILENQGIGDPARRPERPIALLEEPVGPTPGEAQRAQAEVTAEQLTTEMTATAKAVKDAAPKDDVEAQKVDYPQRGKRTKILMHEDKEPSEFGFTSAMWLEVSDWRNGTAEYKIIQAQKFRTDQNYTFNPQRDVTWEEGKMPGRYVERPIAISDPRRYRDGRTSETVFEALGTQELADLSGQFTRAAQEKIAEWQQDRPGRTGGFMLRLLRKR